jgi:hypothetical protein
VFITELDKIKIPGIMDGQGMGLIKVSNPKPYKDLEEWKQRTTEAYTAFKIPSALPTGFTFIKGEIEQSNGGIDEYDQEKYYALLKNKALEANERLAWQKEDPADYAHHTTDLITPKLIYSNAENEQIEVTYTVKPLGVENMNFTGIMGDSSTAEKVQAAGNDAYYTINNSFIFGSNTGFMQDINWLEEADGRTIIYHVSTSSKDVTKEDLLLVANNLK